jgi:lipid biosynthesis B12-binding/radical SAM protein
MSNFFLLSSNISSDPYPVYPLGMAVVAAALNNAGHLVHQYDHLVSGCSEIHLRETLKEFNPDFVGISLRNIDNVDSFSAESEWYLAENRQLVDLIRQETAAPIIVGGSGFSIMPVDILDYLAADYGVVGEGERALCDLVSDLEQGHAVPRIVNGNRSYLSGTDMVSPCWDTVLVRYYSEHSGMVNLQTKRGCAYNCNYCSYPQLEGKRLRFKDPAKIVDEIQHLKQMMGVDTIFFTDSVFNDIAGHYLEFAEELLLRNLNIHWYGFFRPQGMGSTELRLLKRSGLSAMEVGTDAASDATLTGLNKQFNFEEVIQFNQVCLKEGIPSAHFIIFGGPNETFETVEEGLVNIQKLEQCVVFAFAGIRIHPNTELYDRALREGIVGKKDSLLKPVYYFSPNLDPILMNAKIVKAFHGRRDRIFPPSEGLVRMATMNRFGYRGLLWDRLISFNEDEKGVCAKSETYF